MAFLSKESYFNPDELEAPVIGVASDFTPHDSGVHHHLKAQLLYAPSGCMTITTEGRQSILPPTMAVWIPGKVSHRVTMRNIVAYRSVYFDLRCFPRAPGELMILHVNPLLKEIIERISFWPWDMDFDLQKKILAVFWEELNSISGENLTLIVPTDRRVKSFVAQWNKGKAIPPFLNQFAKEVGASEKTISRIFSKETGMPYQDWRQQWRLHKAIELLAEGYNIGETAYELAFSGDSAFIEFFKKYLGETPNKYFH